MSLIVRLYVNDQQIGTIAARNLGLRGPVRAQYEVTGEWVDSDGQRHNAATNVDHVRAHGALALAAAALQAADENAEVIPQ